MHDPSLTLVVPCYNEAARLDTGTFLEWVEGHTARYLCFVDDASTDETGALLARMSEEHRRVSILRLAGNHGKASAVREGMLRVTGTDLVGFWDADLAAPLTEVDGLVGVLKAEPAVQCAAGIRVLRLGARIERSFSRHVISRLFVTLASALLHLPAYDTQCGAKLFRRGAVRPLFSDAFVSRWLFDIELYLRLRNVQPNAELGEIVHEHPLNEWKTVGHSRLGWVDFVKAPFDLWRIYRRYR